MSLHSNLAFRYLQCTFWTQMKQTSHCGEMKTERTERKLKTQNSNPSMLMNVQIAPEKKPKKRTADALWKVNSNTVSF